MTSPTRTPSRYALASDLTITRVLTGLWQVADLERSGQPLPRAEAAQSLLPYAAAGFTTFDMADHYGSAEDIVGHYRAHSVGPAVESLTNTDTAHLRLIVESGMPIVSNQVCYSLLDQRAAGAMAEYCRSKGIALLAFGTLAGGFLSDRWLGCAEPDWESLETWSQMKYGRFIRAAGGWDALQRGRSSMRRRSAA